MFILCLLVVCDIYYIYPHPNSYFVQLQIVCMFDRDLLISMLTLCLLYIFLFIGVDEFSR